MSDLEVVRGALASMMESQTQVLADGSCEGMEQFAALCDANESRWREAATHVTGDRREQLITLANDFAALSRDARAFANVLRSIGRRTATVIAGLNALSEVS